MTRLRFVVVLLVASLLALSACSDVTGGTAATVDGRDVDDGDFRTRLRQLAESPDAATSLLGIPVSMDGEPVEGRVDAAFAASLLEVHVLVELIDAEAEARGIDVTDADIEATRGRLNPELLAVIDSLPDDLARWFLTWNAQAAQLSEALAAEIEIPEVTDEDVQAFYDDNPEAFEGLVCASHVLLDSAEEADEVLAELEGGVDIADLAAERSTDPSAATNGGDLGCSDPARYVPAFAEAITEGEVGEYLGPVESDFGFHVILVRSRGDVPFEEIEAEIRAQLESEAGAAGANPLGSWLQDALEDADVSVSSRYGTWNAESGQVLPPEGPSGGTATLNLG